MCILICIIYVYKMYVMYIVYITYKVYCTMFIRIYTLNLYKYINIYIYVTVPNLNVISKK